MAVFTTSIPDFKFSGLYYPQIRQSLIAYRRQQVPELTDEDDNEPTIQILSAFAAGFHYSNVLLDHVALETLMPSARLRESLRGHLLLIGYELKEAVAATAVLIARLGAPVTVAASVPAGSLFSTKGSSGTPPVVFELVSALALPRTDQIGVAYEDDGGVFTDRTAEMNGTGTFTPWGGVPAANDALYVGHEAAIWTRFTLATSVIGDIWAADDHVWEYYDGSTSDTVPTSVTPGGGALDVDLTSLLGTNNRSGTQVVIKLLATGATETVASTYSGGANRIVTAGVLGQAAPSSDPASYSVGTSWKEVAGLTETVDGTDVSLTFTIPETANRTWKKTTVNSKERYWLRLRMTQATSTAPTVDGGGDIATGEQYLHLDVTQGESATEDPAGTFDGSASQAFITANDDLIEGTLRAFVDEGGGYTEAGEVQDFLSSTSTDLDFTLEFDADGRGIVTFGDGTSGRLPGISASLKLTYRHGAEQDGNVGANEIVVNRSSVSFISTVYNPRAAAGWKAPEGSTTESISALKVAGPASLRLRDRALTLNDMEDLALAFVASDGSSPVIRAKAVADGFGEKTVKLLVVGPSGSTLPQATLDEISEFFTGNLVTGAVGRLVVGLTLTAVNYTQKAINVTVTVAGGTQADIVTAITAYLSPDAKRANGNWEHLFGGSVYASRIISEIFNSDPAVTNVPTGPGSDVALAATELPVPGTITVTVI